MLTCNLIGGLGNKMFQIATTYSLSLENSDDCVFEITQESNAHQPVTSYLENIFRQVKFGPTSCNKTYQEPFFHYSEIPYTTNLRLSGYFQSEKYFIKHRKEITNLFSIDEKNLDYINKKYGKILNNKTCSLHIRRGDYLSLPNHHPVCNIEYYKKSISYFDDETIFLIFSNDIEWCKKNFIGNQFIFIEGEKDYIDLWLMSLCKNNIIANSSFSWWGAWLNTNSDKKVITPKNWFGPAINHSTQDLIPEKWFMI